MREVKFRAWHPTNKVMHIFDLIKAASDVYIAQHFIELLNNTHCEGSDLLMQYTGLKDKNGVEIYVGDVSRKLHYVDDGGEHYLHHLIEWSDKFNGFFARNLNAKDDWDGNLLLWVYAKEDFEIIGSIHENPELLEKNND